MGILSQFLLFLFCVLCVCMYVCMCVCKYVCFEHARGKDSLRSFSPSSLSPIHNFITRIRTEQVLSECCSCGSQREDRAMGGSCAGNENSPGLLPYVTGSLGVWTLMDYFGEPQGQPLHAWPHVSCDFGQFDIAGHPKPHAYWYAEPEC